VIGGRLDLLDSFRVVGIEIIDDLVEHVFHHRGEWWQFGNAGFVGKPLQPTYFDENPVTEQSEFTENIAEGTDLVCVAAVGRGQGFQADLFHPLVVLDLGAQSANHTP
jgi:hypothetical protein